MNASTITTVQVDVVQVQGRYRRDLGDLDSLAQSIADVGLINPITVTSDFRLVAGERRLEAHKLLGRTEIECHVVHSIIDARDLLVAERDENTQRLEMAPSEAAQLGMAIEALEKPAALERQKATRLAGRSESGTAIFGAGPGTRTETEVRPRDIAAEAIGMSEPTYRRIKQAIETAEDAEQPEAVREVARQAVRDIDDGKGARPAVERIKQAKKEATGPQEKPMPAKRPGKPGPSAFPPDAVSIRRVTDSLHGYNIALDRIAGKELDDSVTAEEAAALHSDLTREIRALNRIATQLKNRKTR